MCRRPQRQTSAGGISSLTNRKLSVMKYLQQIPLSSDSPVRVCLCWNYVQLLQSTSVGFSYCDTMLCCTVSNSELSLSVYHSFRTPPLCKVCAYTSPANFMPQLMRISYIRRVRAMVPVAKIPHFITVPPGLLLWIRCVQYTMVFPYGKESENQKRPRRACSNSPGTDSMHRYLSSCSKHSHPL